MEESSSDLSSTTTAEEFDPFLDAPDEFYYDSYRRYSSFSRRRRSASRRELMSSDVETDPSSSVSSNVSEVDGKPSYMENSDEPEGNFETSDKDSDVTESTKEMTDLSPEKESDSDVTDRSGDKKKDTDVIASGLDRVDPLQDGNRMSGEEPEELTIPTVSNDRGNDYARSAPPQLREPDSPSWSLLGFLARLVVKAIEFQVNLVISFITFPPWFLYSCSLFVSDPFSTIRFGRRFLTARVVGISDMIFGTMSPFKFSLLNDPKQMLNVACRFGWGLFWAVYAGTVLFGLLISSLMLGGYMINRIADKPFVLTESLNFDYTKNSPEAYVPITSCAGVACLGSCKEINEMPKIRGLRAIPQDHKLEITLSMTLPESSYNRNLGMFQVRVDFLSADGQTVESIRRPCMLRFRSEPIRLVQTFFKVVPLVTGYVSEIQTLSLKLKGFVEKDIPTACLKVMIEQRAEFRPGAGIPELYDASLSLESSLPFFKQIIWKWRKTLFVWTSMSLFITKLLFTLVCCRPLIMPRTRRRESRDRSPVNLTGST